jgi:hypothetical protein
LTRKEAVALYIGIGTGGLAILSGIFMFFCPGGIQDVMKKKNGLASWRGSGSTVGKRSDAGSTGSFGDIEKNHAYSMPAAMPLQAAVPISDKQAQVEPSSLPRVHSWPLSPRFTA